MYFLFIAATLEDSQMKDDKSYDLKKAEQTYRIDGSTQHRTLIAKVVEGNSAKTEIEDGKYIIFQLGGENQEAIPIFAFEVDYGNFRITSMDGSTDFANLAANIWHLQFSNKQKACLVKIKQLQKQLSRIKKDVESNIERSNRYKKK